MDEVDSAKAEGLAERGQRGSTAPSEAERALAEAVRGALEGNVSPRAVAKALSEGGCPADGAEAILAVARPEAGAPRRSAPKAASDTELTDRYARRILYGFLWTAGGTVVTLASYEAATSGGRYVLAYGAILYGVISMMSGAVGWAKHR